MPFLSSIGLSITSKCPITCKHCIVEAGPHRKEEMSITDAFKWIQQIADYNEGYIKSIVFTGGEPFYNMEQLKQLLNFTVSHGLVPAVATNAYWATSIQDALETLEKLPEIKMLIISTDIYHQQFIPLNYVKNAIITCNQLGIPYNLATCIENENDIPNINIIKKLEDLVDKKLISTSTLLPAGRALKTISNKFPKNDKHTESVCVGADSPTIFPDGKVIGCMAIVMDLPKGHPLLLGNLKEKPLDEILENAEMNTILHILRLWGSKKLIKLLDRSSLTENLPKKYNKCGYCELCYALISDKQLIVDLWKIIDQPEITEKTAYERIFYLKETTMVEKMKKNGSITE